MSSATNSIHILFADDDSDDYEFFKESIIAAGIKVQLDNVEDGEKLMQYILKVEQPPPPDIIFMDINMPFKNGKQCLQEIRENKRFDHVPIIMFSTSDNPKDIEDTFLKGANLYISKMIFFGAEQEVLQYLFAENWKEKLVNIPKERFVIKKPFK
ncbi:MAG: response regulator [Chitinophagaceae bacterium]|nr:response regulator [Chitinophagaceae bacterium]